MVTDRSLAVRSGSAQGRCALCDLTTAHPIRDETGRVFCCPACREVHQLLHADNNQRAAVSASESQVSNLQPFGSAQDKSPVSNPQSTVTLSLGGLWCASCSWLIGETLRRAPGVDAAEMSFVQREARITYDPERANPRQFVRRIRRLGYRAWMPGDKPYDEEEVHLNRLLVGGVLAMKIMAISLILYAREWLGFASPDTEWLAGFFHIMLFVLSLPLMLLLGLPILRAGVASLLRGRPNMHTLIALGAFSAFGLSARNLFLGLDRVYFDTASMLLFLVSVGRWLEMQARKASGDAVERLWKQLPQEAAWITAEGEQRVPADQVPLGAKVRVRPGERFPVDGIVAIGEGDVDESLLTGEPNPVARSAGAKVLAGTVSLDGAFEVVAMAVGAGTVAGQIGRLLHQALWQRAPLERLADKWAALMVPAAVAIAGGTFAFWAARAGSETGLLYALSVLLIACPCALGLATPLTLWLALGRAAEAGVLLRNTAVLEGLAGLRQVFFDKTGTLTQRPFRVQALVTNGMQEQEFLARVAAVEMQSEHPLAQAVVSAARQRELAVGNPDDFRAWPGQGVSGRLGGTMIWVGSRRLMEAQSLSIPENLNATAAEWRQRGLGVMYAGWEGQVTGLLGLGERVRVEATDAVAQLRAMALDVEVLTGDDAAAGERWQQLLNVPVHAEQSPEDKMARLQATIGSVAMIGDGINDGPALAAANVGLALSDGTDVARAAADVILLRDDLRAAPWVISLARTTMQRVRQNLAWAFFYNLIGLGLAVTGILQPVLAAIAMVASSLIVTGNALRLRSVPLLQTKAESPEVETIERQPAAALA